MKTSLLCNFPNSKQNQPIAMQFSQSTQASSTDGKKFESKYSNRWENGEKIHYNHKTTAEEPKRSAMIDPC